MDKNRKRFEKIFLRLLKEAKNKTPDRQINLLSDAHKQQKESLRKERRAYPATFLEVLLYDLTDIEQERKREPDEERMRCARTHNFLNNKPDFRNKLKTLCG